LFIELIFNLPYNSEIMEKTMNKVSMINGSVQSQGIRVDVRDWLDMGSEGWRKTPEEIKAAAYQAAKVTGWTDKGICALILSEFGPRIDEFQANLTLELLKEYEAKYPLEQEVLENKEHKDTWKVSGSETQFPFPN
jgi:hypothetical protein